VIAVDRDLEEIRVELTVAPHEAGGDTLATVRVVHLGADVERVVIEEKTDFRALRRRFALVRVYLTEVGNRCRRLPGRIVEFRVQHDRRRAPHRMRARHRDAMTEGGRSRLRRLAGVLCEDRTGDREENGGREARKAHGHGFS
jgi:hypothetical protein